MMDAMKCFINKKDVSDRMKSHFPNPSSRSQSFFLSFSMREERERERERRSEEEREKRAKRDSGREREEKEKEFSLLTFFELTFAFAAISRRTHSLWPFSDA